MKRAPWLVLPIAVFLGCAMGPNYQRPRMATPEQFRDFTKPMDAASLADRPWWDIFADPNLQALIDEALAKGFDARLAAARVEEYRAKAGIARGGLFPQVGGAGQWQRARESTYAYPYGQKPVGESYGAQFQLSWELDVWGRLRRLNEVARAQYLGTVAGQRGVLLTLLAEVASGYYTLCELDRELEIAQETQRAYQSTFDLFNLQLQGGTASALQTASAEGALGSVAASVPSLEAQISSQENTLSNLLGRMPGPITRSKLPSGAELPLDVPAGLPSALLERRPDILEAEQALVAANANIGASKASMFPTLSLTGIFGGVSPQVNDLFGRGQAWSVVPSLLQPLFYGGKLWFQYQAAKAMFGEALVQYEQAVTYAFGETAGALVTHQKLAEAEKQQARSVAAYAEAVRVSNQRYAAGLSSYYEVLEAQQSLYPAQVTLAKLRFQRLDNFVTLYKALGGGWKNPSQERPPAEPAIAGAQPGG